MSGFISILFTSWILYTHAHCAKKTMTMSHKWPNFYKSNFRNYIFTILLREREVETMWWRRGRTSRGGKLIFVKISILYFKFFISHPMSFHFHTSERWKKRRANTNPFNYVMCVTLALLFEGIQKRIHFRETRSSYWE